MRIISQASVPAEHRKSPKGTYEIIRRHVSVALGAPRSVGPWGGGHPFEVEVARIPPGRKGYPYHSHAAQTEYYAVLSGRGTVIDEKGGRCPIAAGDHFVFLPGEAHQVLNDSGEDLEYIVIADNHRADLTTYPATGKRMLMPEARCVRPVPADYYEGEE
jgi:uncharacterized cupin superfamily protein